MIELDEATRRARHARRTARHDLVEEQRRRPPAAPVRSRAAAGARWRLALRPPPARCPSSRRRGSGRAGRPGWPSAVNTMSTSHAAPAASAASSFARRKAGSDRRAAQHVPFQAWRRSRPHAATRRPLAASNTSVVTSANGTSSPTPKRDGRPGFERMHRPQDRAQVVDRLAPVRLQVDDAAARRPRPEATCSGRMPTTTAPAAAGGQAPRPRRRGCSPAGRFARQEIDRRRADEAGDEQAVRPVVEIVGRADLLDPALAHADDAVGHRRRLDLVVGDQDRRHAELALQAADLAAHASGAARRRDSRAARRGAEAAAP